MNKQKILKIVKAIKKVKNVRQFIKSADSIIIRVLAEIALNIHRRRIGLTKLVRKGLLQFDSLLHEFGCRYSGHDRLEQNRKVLLNHSSSRGVGLGCFLQFLIKASIHILPQIVGSIVRNK